MKLSFRVVMTVLVISCALAICSTTAVAQDAAANYKAQKCAMCHGADGKGSAVGLKMGAHDFTSPDVQKQTDAQLTEAITKGKNKMPAYAGKLKDSEIKDLVAYVHSLGKK